MHVKCDVCGSMCHKYGKNKSGSQRWKCPHCLIISTTKIDNNAKYLKIFLNWLFGKQIQKNMPGQGRNFRRKTSKFWDIWPMPPKIEESKDIVFVDGIYIAKKACILICCDKNNVLGWYLCRYEHSRAWQALMSRIATPKIVVSDGGHGFEKALRVVWKGVRHQRCLFHVFSQVRRYTTRKPKTFAGIELYMLSKELLKINSKIEADEWVSRFVDWIIKYKEFLSQMTIDEYGKKVPTHQRLLKAKRSIQKLIKQNTLFTYLDNHILGESQIPSTNNYIEGGVNAQLRAMLREHRGLSVERRIKAVYWWCYMHSPNPLSASEIIKVMPTDKSISDIYAKLSERNKIDKTIPTWGDAIVWGELHMHKNKITYWD